MNRIHFRMSDDWSGGWASEVAHRTPLGKWPAGTEINALVLLMG